MVIGDLPSFSDHARDSLCRSPESFRSTYGTHYVSGEAKGASIEMRVEITTKSSKDAKSLGAKLEAKGSYSGVSAEASASLKAEMSSASEVSKTETTVKIKGGDRGRDVIKKLDIVDGSKAILSFGEKANTGATLAYQLFSYQEHPEYMRTVACCSAPPKTAEPMDRKVAKLLLTELIGLHTLESWIENDRDLDAEAQYTEWDKC